MKYRKKIGGKWKRLNICSIELKSFANKFELIDGVWLSMSVCCACIAVLVWCCERNSIGACPGRINLLAIESTFIGITAIDSCASNWHMGQRNGKTRGVSARSYMYHAHILAHSHRTQTWLIALVSSRYRITRLQCVWKRKNLSDQFRIECDAIVDRSPGWFSRTPKIRRQYHA